MLLPGNYPRIVSLARVARCDDACRRMRDAVPDIFLFFPTFRFSGLSIIILYVLACMHFGELGPAFGGCGWDCLGRDVVPGRDPFMMIAGPFLFMCVCVGQMGCVGG